MNNTNEYSRRGLIASAVGGAAALGFGGTVLGQAAATPAPAGEGKPASCANVIVIRGDSGIVARLVSQSLAVCREHSGSEFPARDFPEAQSAGITKLSAAAAAEPVRLATGQDW